MKAPIQRLLEKFARLEEDAPDEKILLNIFADLSESYNILVAKFFSKIPSFTNEYTYSATGVLEEYCKRLLEYFGYEEYMSNPKEMNDCVKILEAQLKKSNSPILKNITENLEKYMLAECTKHFSASSDGKVIITNAKELATVFLVIQMFVKDCASTKYDRFFHKLFEEIRREVLDSIPPSYQKKSKSRLIAFFDKLESLFSTKSYFNYED